MRDCAMPRVPQSVMRPWALFSRVRKAISAGELVPVGDITSHLGIRLVDRSSLLGW